MREMMNDVPWKEDDGEDKEEEEDGRPRGHPTHLSALKRFVIYLNENDSCFVKGLYTEFKFIEAIFLALLFTKVAIICGRIWFGTDF